MTSSNVSRTAADVLAQDMRHIRESCPSEFAAMAGRQVLMTGGAGFLGYEMINALASTTTAMPRRPTGSGSWSSTTSSAAFRPGSRTWSRPGRSRRSSTT